MHPRFIDAFAHARGVDFEAGIAEALALMFEKVAADCFVRPAAAS